MDPFSHHFPDHRPWCVGCDTPGFCVRAAGAVAKVGEGAAKGGVGRVDAMEGAG